MRCSACGARSDPDRSFCQRCGSAVFLDDASFLRSRVLSYERASQPVQAPALGGSEHVQAPTTGASEHVQAPATRMTQAARQAARRTVRTATTPAVGAGCVGSLVRWAIFFAIASYAYNIIGSLPEVREAVRALGRGEQVDLTPAANAIRSLVGLPPSEPSSQPAAEPASTPRTPSPGASTRATERPANGRPDLAIYEPGQIGSIAPTVVTRVPARYPPDAVREGIQGTVILRCIVEPDGSVSSATVTRSIDSRFGLDDEAVRAVRQWRFEPGRREGVPVRVATLVTVTFALRAATGAPPAR
jgi:TonB family protein